MQNETIKVLQGTWENYNLGIEKAFLAMTKNLESIKKEIDKFSYKRKQTKLSTK